MIYLLGDSIPLPLEFSPECINKRHKADPCGCRQRHEGSDDRDRDIPPRYSNMIYQHCTSETDRHAGKDEPLRLEIKEEGARRDMGEGKELSPEKFSDNVLIENHE